MLNTIYVKSPTEKGTQLNNIWCISFCSSKKFSKKEIIILDFEKP